MADCSNLLLLSWPLPSPVYLPLSPSLVVDCYIAAHCVCMPVVAEAPPVPVGGVGTPLPLGREAGWEIGGYMIVRFLHLALNVLVIMHVY